MILDIAKEGVSKAQEKFLQALIDSDKRMPIVSQEVITNILSNTLEQTLCSLNYQIVKAAEKSVIN